MSPYYLVIHIHILVQNFHTIGCDIHYALWLAVSHGVGPVSENNHLVRPHRTLTVTTNSLTSENIKTIIIVMTFTRTF